MLVVLGGTPVERWDRILPPASRPVQPKQITPRLGTPHVNVFHLWIFEQRLCRLLFVATADAHLPHQRAIFPVCIQRQQSPAIFFGKRFSPIVPLAIPRVHVHRPRQWRHTQLAKWVVVEKIQLFFVYLDQPQAMAARCAPRRYFFVCRESISRCFLRASNRFGNCRRNGCHSKRSHDSPRWYFSRQVNSANFPKPLLSAKLRHTLKSWKAVPVALPHSSATPRSRFR